MTKVKISTADLRVTFEEYKTEYNYSDTTAMLLMLAEILAEMNEHLEGIENRMYE